MPSVKEVQAEVDEQDAIITAAVEVLEAAYTPEATRADLVEAVSGAIDILTGEEDSDSEDITEDDE